MGEEILAKDDFKKKERRLFGEKGYFKDFCFETYGVDNLLDFFMKSNKRARNVEVYRKHGKDDKLRVFDFCGGEYLVVSERNFEGGKLCRFSMSKSLEGFQIPVFKFFVRESDSISQFADELETRKDYYEISAQWRNFVKMNPECSFEDWRRRKK